MGEDGGKGGIGKGFQHQSGVASPSSVNRPHQRVATDHGPLCKGLFIARQTDGKMGGIPERIQGEMLMEGIFPSRGRKDSLGRECGKRVYEPLLFRFLQDYLLQGPIEVLSHLVFGLPIAVTTHPDRCQNHQQGQDCHVSETLHLFCLICQKRI